MNKAEERIAALELELSAHSVALMNMAQGDEMRWEHCAKYGWPSRIGLVHGGSTWRAPDAKGGWWAGNTPIEAINAAMLNSAA